MMWYHNDTQFYARGVARDGARERARGECGRGRPEELREAGRGRPEVGREELHEQGPRRGVRKARGVAQGGARGR
jgi:hypothetical protein